MGYERVAPEARQERVAETRRPVGQTALLERVARRGLQEKAGAVETRPRVPTEAPRRKAGVGPEATTAAAVAAAVVGPIRPEISGRSVAVAAPVLETGPGEPRQERGDGAVKVMPLLRKLAGLAAAKEAEPHRKPAVVPVVAAAAAEGDRRVRETEAARTLPGAAAARVGAVEAAEAAGAAGAASRQPRLAAERRAVPRRIMGAASPARLVEERGRAPRHQVVEAAPEAATAKVGKRPRSGWPEAEALVVKKTLDGPHGQVADRRPVRAVGATPSPVRKGAAIGVAASPGGAADLSRPYV